MEHSSEKHAEYNICISGYMPEQLIFVDKSSVDHHSIIITEKLGLPKTRKLLMGHFAVVVKGKWLYLLIISILIIV